VAKGVLGEQEAFGKEDVVSFMQLEAWWNGEKSLVRKSGGEG